MFVNNSRVWNRKFAYGPANVNILFGNDHLEGKHNLFSGLNGQIVISSNYQLFI
jgi:hypothetical protein